MTPKSNKLEAIDELMYSKDFVKTFGIDSSSSLREIDFAIELAL